MDILLQDMDTLQCKSFDLNINGMVDFLDFGMFTDDYYSGCLRSDFNWDGIVNMLDFYMFANHWGHKTR